MSIRKLFKSKLVPWSVLSVLGLAPLLMAGAPRPMTPPTQPMTQEETVPSPEMSEENLDPTALAIPEADPTWSVIILPLPEVQEPIAATPEVNFAEPEVATEPNITFNEPVTVREEIPFVVVGAVNPIVADIQNYLQVQGLYNGQIDSVYGVETERAVREFQRQNNLTPDGVVGSETWMILRDETDV